MTLPSPLLRKAAGRRSRAAFSLAEMMMAAGVGSLVLGAVASLTIFSARSFVGLGNYMELDRASRHALDSLSRDIRQTAGVKSFTDTSLVLTNRDSSQVVFNWSAGSRQLTAQRAGVTRTLLTECDYLRFTVSQRNPSNGVFGFYPAANAGLGKLVDVNWRCSRTLLGKKFHTESVQTAKIVIRN